MKQFLLGLSLSFAFILGCVTAAAVNSNAHAAPEPDAAPPVGVTECFATTLWYSTGKQLNDGKLPQTVRVPPGWTPLGGGAGEAPGMVLCRTVAAQ